MTSHKSKEPRTYRTEPRGPLTWADLCDVQDSHGIRPVPHDPTARPWEADRIHDLYEQWIDFEGIRPERRYVMPLCVLFTRLQRDYGHHGRALGGQLARRLLVDAVNDPSSGLEIVERPFTKKRRRSSVA